MAVNHEAKLIENITNMMKRDSFNDVRIRLSNGVQIDANKGILSAMSTFFFKKLHENEVQKSTSDGKFLEVDLDISSTKDMLELVIKYLYTGKMDFESLILKDLIDLLNLLKFLELDDLMLEVEANTLKMIEEGGFALEKILILSSTAEANGLNNVVSTMLDYLDENIRDVSELSEVQYISSNFLLSLLADINGEGNEIDDERFFPRFVTLTSWLTSTDEVDVMLKTRLISMFDLKRFTNQQLTSAVRKSKLFSESSILDVLSQRVTNIDVKVDELEKKKNNLEAEVKELEEDVEKLQEKVDECDMNKHVVDNKIRGYEMKLSKEKENVQILKRKYVQLEAENKKYKIRCSTWSW